MSNVVDMFDNGWTPVSRVGEDNVKVFANTRRKVVLADGNSVSVSLGQCGSIPVELCAMDGDVYNRVFMRAHGSDVVSRTNNAARLSSFVINMDKVGK